jgi:hypothetical protein
MREYRLLLQCADHRLSALPQRGRNQCSPKAYQTAMRWQLTREPPLGNRSTAKQLSIPLGHHLYTS